MKSLFHQIREENASTMVESIIVMPIVLILVFSILLLAFSLHDRSTMEGAARRGAIYAAHCICDPNYDAIKEKSGGLRGELDYPYEVSSFNFTGLGHNIKPYRYITGSSSDIEDKVKNEVQAILNKTRIPWHELKTDSITYTKDNRVFYVKVTVSIEGSYPIHTLFSRIGLGNSFDLSSSATVTVNDPDEFVRNADLAVDMIIEIDNRTGGNLQRILKDATDKVGQLCGRLKTWIDWLKL